MIIVLADVAQNDGRDGSIEIVRNEIRRDFVRQVPAAAHHPLLHGPGIRSNPQHFQIVIGFEHNHLAAA